MSRSLELDRESLHHEHEPAQRSDLMRPLLVACSGGGNPALAWLIILVGLAAWGLLTLLMLRTAKDRSEVRLLIGLLIGSIVLGPLITAAYYGGLFGSDSSVLKLVLLLTFPGLIGVVVAHLTRGANRLRAFLVSVWGAVFLIGAGVFLIFVAFAVGGACIE
jgi:hypothetical protein